MVVAVVEAVAVVAVAVVVVYELFTMIHGSNLTYCFKRQCC